MNRKTVLCVDDEVSILNSLRRLLRKETYTLLTAGSGREGLSELEEHPVHLVISDQRMPEMTGIEFLRQVKERFPDTVRVVLSGYANVNLIVDAINEGEVYRFLTKPWNDEELKAAIRQCLQHYDILEQNRMLLEQSRRQNEQLKRLNERLEEAVQDRTRSLQLSQNILEKLPIPVVGVSREGIIVMANESARQIFPEIPGLCMGMDYDEVFPPEVIELVRRCLCDGQPCDSRGCKWNGHRLHIRIEPLADGDLLRGCILALEVLGK
jgi:FixJ family two-component response regulator